MDIIQIKNRLKEKNMTYEDLSKKSGVPIQTIQKVLAGITKTPRIDTVEAIEKALGIVNKPVVELSHIKKKLIDIISQLSDENVEKAIAILTVINK